MGLSMLCAGLWSYLLWYSRYCARYDWATILFNLDCMLRGALSQGSNQTVSVRFMTEKTLNQRLNQ